MIPHRTIFSGFRIPSVRPSVRPPFRPQILPLRPQIQPLRPQIRPLRPQIKPLRPKILPLRIRNSETGENRPVWNHRSSAPPGPLPKKGKMTLKATHQIEPLIHHFLHLFFGKRGFFYLVPVSVKDFGATLRALLLVKEARVLEIAPFGALGQRLHGGSVAQHRPHLMHGGDGIEFQLLGRGSARFRLQPRGAEIGLNTPRMTLF